VCVRAVSLPHLPPALTPPPQHQPTPCTCAIRPTTHSRSQPACWELRTPGVCNHTAQPPDPPPPLRVCKRCPPARLAPVYILYCSAHCGPQLTCRVSATAEHAHGQTSSPARQATGNSWLTCPYPAAAQQQSLYTCLSQLNDGEGEGAGWSRRTGHLHALLVQQKFVHVPYAS
jgi:hypothetical protein